MQWAHVSESHTSFALASHFGTRCKKPTDVFADSVLDKSF